MATNMFYVWMKPDNMWRIDVYTDPQKVPGSWATDMCAKGFKEHTGLTLKKGVLTKMEVMVVAHEPLPE